MITYLYAMMDGPSGLQIKQRAGHSLGKINDAYVLSRGAGDAFCGRCLRFTSLQSEEFARLPPHFKQLRTGDVDLLNIRSLFPEIYHANSGYTTQFKELVPFLYARIVYSWDYIKSKLHPRHKLFDHAAIQALLEPERLNRIRSHLVGLTDENKYFECKCGCGMTASGVPALTVQSHQMAELRRSLENGQRLVIENIRSVLGQYEANKEEMCVKISEYVFDKINDNIEWSEKGASVKELMNYIKSEFGTLKSNLEEASNNNGTANDRNEDIIDDNAVGSTIASESLQSTARPHGWAWVNQGEGKRDGWVPEDFDIRGKTFQSVFANHWFNGCINPSDGFRIRPFHQLKGSDLPMVMGPDNTKLIKQQVNWGRTRAGIIGFIDFIKAQEHDIYRTSPSNITKEKYEQIVKSLSVVESDSNNAESTLIRNEMLTKHISSFLSQTCGRPPEESRKINDKKHLLKVVTIGKWFKECKLERDGRCGETRGRKKRGLGLHTNGTIPVAVTSSEPDPPTMHVNKVPRND